MTGFLKHIICSMLIIVCFCGTSLADGDKITGLIIKGNRRIEAAVILNAIKVKSGDSLDIERVDSDIRAIYKLGYFHDVKAETVKTDKGVDLIYTVMEKPTVREIRIEGNKEITTEKIREAFTLKPGSVFSATEQANGIKKVKKIYKDEGYYLAEVSVAAEKQTGADMRIVLKITEGKKILIKKIRFEGNKAFTEKKLKGVMETGEKWFMSWLTGGGTYKEDVLKNDIALISDLYYNNGYVNVKIGEPKVELMSDKSGLLITIGITEGDQFKVGAIDYKGDILDGKEALARKVKLKTGEVFSRMVLRNDIISLTDMYADQGYAYANITPLTNVDTANKTISITFDFEKGEKVSIDRINISGNTKTRDKVVRREMKLVEGDLYGATPLKQSKQNLMNTGFFEEANISTAKGSAANTMNVNVEVKEKPTGTFSVGAGYSSLDGIIGQGSVQQANFLGLGLKANLAASLGGKSQTYNVGLSDPYFLDSRWTLGGDIYRTERTFIDFSRRVTGGDVKAGYPLSDTINALMVYRYEDKTIYDESQTMKANIALGLMPQPDLHSTISSVSMSINRNSTDYRLDPTTGMMNSLSLEFAGIGGSTRFLRSIGSSTLFVPFKWGTVFSFRGEIGNIQGLGKTLPIDEKFYLGGINTVRGYASRTISPYVSDPTQTNFSNGTVANGVSHVYQGGDSETVFNVEYVFPLLKDAGLKGVTFFDIGNSADGFNNVFGHMQASYGLGIRWFSPIGPLRLEYGIPVNPRSGIDNSGGKFEFSIGSFF